jgi:hypothetical protein
MLVPWASLAGLVVDLAAVFLVTLALVTLLGGMVKE